MQETPVMDESSLRELLRGATEPEPPIGQLVSNSLRAGARVRRRRLVLSAAAAAASIAAIGVVTAMLTGAPGRPPATRTATAEPSAGQLIHGHWVRMPPAPIQMCGPLAVWDGRDLVAIQEPGSSCPLGAAEYDPLANRWTKIAAPPMLKGQRAVDAAGGGRVVVVLNTGATYSWRQVTGRWQRLGTLPAGRNQYSVAWTGRTFLVTRLYSWGPRGPGKAFELAGRRWTALPDLPQPPRGRLEQALPIALNGAVYVLVSIMVTHHTTPNGQPGLYGTGYVELLRLTSSGWSHVPLGPGGPKSELELAQVHGAILAAGSYCGGLCTQENGSAALLRPGSSASVTPLKPPLGVPYPWNFAAGSRAIVVTYTAGLGDLSYGQNIPPGTCYVYDLATGTWRRGPTAPASPLTLGPAYWTPVGVISLGQSDGGVDPALARTGGWLLRPAGSRSARQ